MKKRLLSLALVLCMTFSVMPTNLTFAEGTPTDLAPIVAETPVEVMTAEPEAPANDLEADAPVIAPAEEPVVSAEVSSAPAEEPAAPAEEPAAPAEEPAAPAEEPAAPAEEPAAPAEEPAAPAEEPAAPAEEPAEEDDDLGGIEVVERGLVNVDKVTGLSCSAVTYNSVTVDWSAATNATEYEIQYRRTTDTAWTGLPTTTSLTGTISGLTCGTEYYVRIRGVNVAAAGNSYGEYSNLLKVKPIPETPTISDCRQDNTISTSVYLSWSIVNGAGGYYVYRSQDGGSMTLLRAFTGNATTLAYTDTDLAIGSTYAYQVTAWRKVNDVVIESLPCSEQIIEIKPLKPTYLIVNPVSSNSLELTWTAVSGATSYIITRSTSSGGTYVQIGTSSTATYQDSGLITDAKYYYKVAAVMNGVTGEYCDAEFGIPTMIAPTNFKAVNAAADSISLSWDVDPMATGYKISYATDSAGPYTTVNLTDNIGQYTLGGLTPSTQYFFKIQTYITIGATDKDGPESTIITAATNPEQPQNLTVEVVAYDKLKLTWDAPTSPVDGFELYRSTDGSNYTLYKTLPATPLSFSDENLTCGTTYYYYLRSFKTVTATTRYSKNSSKVKGRPIPATPTINVVDAKNGTTVMLKFSNVPEATGYVVFGRIAGEDEYTQLSRIAQTADTEVTAVVTGLQTGAEYQFMVRAYRTVGTTNVYSVISDMKSLVMLPASPNNFKAEVWNETIIYLSWDESTGADGYQVFISDFAPMAIEDMTMVAQTADSFSREEGLIPGKEYWFCVRPYVIIDGMKLVGYETSFLGPIVPVPAAPTGFIGTAQDTGTARLEWNEVDFVYNDEHGYLIDYSDNGGDTWTGLVVLVDDTDFYVDNTVTIGKTRIYRMRSYVYADGSRVESKNTATVSVLTKPMKAASLKAAVTTDAKVELTFTGAAAPVKYLVYRSTSATSGFASVGTASGATEEISFTDSGVTAGKTYYYKVRPFVASGSGNVYGDYSAVVSVQAKSGVPQNVKVTGLTASSAKITWDAAPGAEGYVIYRAASSISAFSAIATVGSSVKEYVDSNLVNGASYVYRVRSYVTVDGKKVLCGLGENAYLICRPTAPATFKASTTYSSITLTWSKAEGAIGYVINDGASDIAELDASTTSYTISNVTCGNYFSYEIYSLYENEWGIKEKCATPNTVSGIVRPARVTDFKAVNLNGAAHLTWSAVDGAVNYQVQYSDNGTSFTDLPGSPLNAVKIDDTTLVMGQVRYYRIRAIGANSTAGSYSSVVQLTGIPATPKDLKAVSTGITAVKLTWTAVSGATKYQIYRSTSASSGFALVDTVTTNSCSMGGLTCGTTYYFKIRAIVEATGKTVYSEYSATVNAKPVPKAPVLTVTRASATSVKISWPAVSGASGYMLQYKDATATTWTTISSSLTKTEYTLSGLTYNHTYEFRCRAYRTVNKTNINGAMSAVAKHTLSPVTVTGVTATSLSVSSIKVTWTAQSGAVGYEVDYSSTSTFTTFNTVTTTTNSVTLTGLGLGTKVYIRVRAYAKAPDDSKVYGGYSTVVVGEATAPVTTISISGSTTSSITLKWDKKDGIVGYRVYSKSTVGATFVKLTDVTDITATGYTDSTVTLGETRYYMVRTLAIDSDGNEIESKDSNTVYLTVKPPKPTMTVSAMTAVTVTMKWADVGGNGYVIRISETSGKLGTPKTLAAGTTTYTFTGLTVGKAYYITLEAYGLDGSTKVYGPRTAEVKVTPVGAAPATVTGTPVNATTMKVTWSAVTYCPKYNVYLREGSATASMKLVAENVTGTTTTLTGLKPGVNYYVTVRGIRSGVLGKPGTSAAVKLTVPTPGSVKATALSGRKVAITFNAVSGATGYQVYASDSATGTYSRVATIKTNRLDLTNQTVGVVTYYKVRAYVTVNGNPVYSAFSTVVSVAPKN